MEFLLLGFFLVGTAFSVQEFLSEFQKSHQEAQSKFASLQQEDELEYHKKVSESQAKFLFNFMDKDKNTLLDREELIIFAKLTVNNDTESAEIWADMTLQEDKSGDRRLTFKEFYQPIHEYGVRNNNVKKDERHQHKAGYQHKTDPRQKQEL